MTIKDGTSHKAMEKILQCTNLTQLTLTSNFDFKPGCFLPFQRNTFPYLKYLFAPGCNMGTEDLVAIAQGCPVLEKIGLEANRKIQDQGIVALCNSTTRRLTFISCLSLPKLTDTAMKSLASVPSFTRVFFGSLKCVRDEGLIAFCKGNSTSTLQFLVCIKKKKKKKHEIAILFVQFHFFLFPFFSFLCGQI